MLLANRSQVMAIDVAARPPSAADTERFRLRAFVESLRGTPELEVRSAPARLVDVAPALEANPKAVLFESLGDEGAQLVGNLLGSRNRFAAAFGVGPRELLGEVLRRLRNKPEFVTLTREQAPVQEVVRTGQDADLTALPINLQHGLDGGLYISAAMDFAKDVATGWTNVGLRRLMVRGPHETGVDLVAPSDLRNIYQAALRRGEGLPLSIVVGAHPADYLASSMRIPVDELGLLSALRGAPLPVVKSVTNDILVPADAEYVIEGMLGPEGYVESEGPFGEFLGYYGGVKTNPVFHVSAITHRRDALFQTLTIGGRTMGYTDTAQLTTLRTEVLVWRALENAVREPVAIYAVPSSAVYTVRVAMRQRVPGEARNAIAAAFGSQANVKNVFVVDPDIDVFDDQQMDWALATRFQPERDLVVDRGFRTLPLDPSLDAGAETGSKVGFDLTLPFGGKTTLEHQVPEPPTFRGARFPTLRAALEDGPKYFEELMAAYGSDDGRELLRELDDLRRSGALRRDPERGRYYLA